MIILTRNMNYLTAKAEINGTKGYKIFAIYNLKTHNQVGYVIEDKNMMFNKTALYHIRMDNGYQVDMVNGDDLDNLLEQNCNCYL